jgi:hypothetical protein
VNKALCGSVGFKQGLVDASFVTTQKQLLVNWNSFDLDGARGILCLGTQAMVCNLNTISDISAGAGSISIADQSLPEGADIFATVRIVHSGRLDCGSSSAALRLDTSGPKPGLVSVGYDAGTLPFWTNK